VGTLRFFVMEGEGGGAPRIENPCYAGKKPRSTLTPTSTIGRIGGESATVTHATCETNGPPDIFHAEEL